MRKSKYLILSSLYFKFNDDLTELDSVKKSFDTQNILDLLRFDKLEKISDNQFHNKNIDFVFLSNNIKKIEIFSFANNNIKYLDLSKFDFLKSLYLREFIMNQINLLKLPNNIELIGESVFRYNQIKRLNLSNCDKLESIDDHAFSDNQIEFLILSNYIGEIDAYAFSNNHIKILDFFNCERLIKIHWNAFLNNPLTEIKILGNVTIDYDDRIYKNNIWNDFVKCYNESGKCAGDYKYENGQWKLYPLSYGLSTEPKPDSQ